LFAAKSDWQANCVSLTADPPKTSHPAQKQNDMHHNNNPKTINVTRK